MYGHMRKFIGGNRCCKPYARTLCARFFPPRAFLTLFRERQPPNGGCREPYLAEYDPSRRTTRDGRTDKKSFEKPYLYMFALFFLGFS